VIDFTQSTEGDNDNHGSNSKHNKSEQ